MTPIPTTMRRLLATSAVAVAALGAGATAASAAEVNILSEPTVAEDGTAKFSFNYAQAGGEPAMSFDVELQGGTAGAGDFEPADKISIDEPACAAGMECSGAGTFLVKITDDALDEDDETLVAKVTNLVGGTAPGGGEADTAIVDNDETPTLQLGGASVLESAGSAQGTFRLSAPSGRDVRVDYGTVSGSAVSGVDFGGRAETLVIPAGQTQGTFAVPVFGDTEAEPDETFGVLATNAVNATLTGADATFTIRNDDAAGAQASGVPGAAGGFSASGGNQALAPQAQQGPGGAAAQGEDDLGMPVGLSFKGMTSGPKVRVTCDAGEQLCHGRLQVKLLGQTAMKTIRFRVRGGESKTYTIRLRRSQRRKLRNAGQVYVKAITQDAAGNRSQTVRGWNL